MAFRRIVVLGSVLDIFEQPHDNMIFGAIWAVECCSKADFGLLIDFTILIMLA